MGRLIVAWFIVDALYVVFAYLLGCNRKAFAEADRDYVSGFY